MIVVWAQALRARNMRSPQATYMANLARVFDDNKAATEAASGIAVTMNGVGVVFMVPGWLAGQPQRRSATSSAKHGHGEGMTGGLWAGKLWRESAEINMCYITNNDLQLRCYERFAYMSIEKINLPIIKSPANNCYITTINVMN